VAFALGASGAHAQNKEADAERLFREGQKLLEERRFGEACPKFELAYSKDRQLGTLLNLAFCHKEQGALWYAWLEFREAELKATELNRVDRRDFAKQRLLELEKQLPRLVVDNPRKVPLTDVLIEDRKVWDAERGHVFAAEPGQRKFVFRAQGKMPATSLIKVSGSPKVQHVSVPVMQDGAAEAPATTDVGATAEAADPTDTDAKAGARTGSTQRTLGWIAMGVGAVAAVVGVVEGIITLSSPCNGGKACDADDRSSASTTGTISDVSFVVAGLGLGGGAILLLTAPSPSRARSALGPAPSTGLERPARAGGLDVTPRLGLGFVGLTGRF
jgi:hypothetical protein